MKQQSITIYHHEDLYPLAPSEVRELITTNTREWIELEQKKYHMICAFIQKLLIPYLIYYDIDAVFIASGQKDLDSSYVNIDSMMPPDSIVPIWNEVGAEIKPVTFLELQAQVQKMLRSIYPFLTQDLYIESEPIRARYLKDQLDSQLEDPSNTYEAL